MSFPRSSLVEAEWWFERAWYEMRTSNLGNNTADHCERRLSNEGLLKEHLRSCKHMNYGHGLQAEPHTPVHQLSTLTKSVDNTSTLMANCGS